MSSLVSVIIPNYNHARYLEERIQSILSQTYQHFELIILDDCSTDNSLEIINKYRDDAHITHIVVNERNSGLTFSQWKKGMELAKGRLIWIAESDDKCEANMLERLVEKFSQDCNCVLAYCRSSMFDDGGRHFEHAPLPDSDEAMSGGQFIRKYMSVGNDIWNASSVLFRKDIALEMDDGYASYKGAGDRLLWIEMAEKGNVAIINQRLNYFRQHNNNSTKKNYASGVNQKEDKRILEYIYAKGYISRWLYLKRKIQYTQQFIIGKEFDTEEIRNSVVEQWASCKLVLWLAYLYDDYLKLRKHI